MSAICRVRPPLHTHALLVPTGLPALVVLVGKVAITMVFDPESVSSQVPGSPCLAGPSISFLDSQELKWFSVEFCYFPCCDDRYT